MKNADLLLFFLTKKESGIEKCLLIKLVQLIKKWSIYCKLIKFAVKEIIKLNTALKMFFQ